MASQFAPEALPIVDPGNVPEIWLDGLAAFSEHGTVMRAAFYSLRPLFCGTPCTWHPNARLIVAKLVFPIPALETMRRQADVMRLPVRAIETVAAMRC